VDEQHANRYGLVHLVLLDGNGTVIVALTAAIAFGAIDQYLGAIQSSFLTAASGMSAPWLLMPFLAGATQGRQRRAALVGLLATWLSVLPLLLEPATRLLAARFGLAYVGGLPLQAAIYSPAALAEAAFGLMATGVIIMKMARATRKL
jgi:hypothetical protein